MREVPEQPGATAFVVVLADGSVPLLVREFGQVSWISLHWTRSWSSPGGKPSAATLQEVVAATRAWAESGASKGVTLYEIALHVADRLSDALGERWTISFPGVADPREAWLHGLEFDAAAVGVFPGRAMVWLGKNPREFEIGSRGELTTRGEGIVAAVREQLAAYRGNVAISEQIRHRAEDLASRLGERLGVVCRVEVGHRPTHAQAIEAAIFDASIELARVFGRGKVVRIHAGLVGDEGWEGSDADGNFEAIVAAIEVARRTLTIERLVVGHDYRVIKSIGELRKGMIVRFVGFDDVDNHYGIYQFADSDGRTLGVPGDYSTPRNSPLGQAHRYLEPVD